MKIHICTNCGHTDIPPFYDLRRIKRKRYNIKDELYCPVCKNHTDISESINAYLTKEEIDARQVGKPCVKNDGGTYKNAFAYYETYVCKQCGYEIL